MVTRLVSNSLNERLTNQLLEAGRVVSDGLARQEIKHVETGRLVAYTRGVAEALQKGDRDLLAAPVMSLAGGLDSENLILVDRQGEELLHLIKLSNGNLMDVPNPTGSGSLPIVQQVLSSSDPNMQPLRALGRNPVDQRYYYYTVLPVVLDNQIVGAVIVGTSLDKILPELKSISLADLIIYDEGGQAIATTVGTQSTAAQGLSAFSIPAQEYDQLVKSNEIVKGENFSESGRWYSLARGSLRIANDHLGVFAVVLPMNYVIQPGAASRNIYIALFTAAMIAVIAIGYGISLVIVNPLSSLVRTSQTIAQGDLNQRTGIRSKDEIGTLASTFDDMTANLQQRTAELERTYHVLEQMDATKVRFIEISAHELRSPLTVAKAYAQMVLAKTQDNAEVQSLAKGLLEGVDRMIETVNSMLDASKIDSNSLKLVPDPITISSVIMKVQKNFQSSLEERNLSMILDGLYELPAINADPDLLYKVFFHLIMNAIKYTPDGGWITVRGRKIQEDHQTPQVEIVVEDTGIGVAPEYHDLIFEKFFQTGEVMLHSSGKTKFKGGGPGLGLAIAKGIVVAHQGRIWIESPGCDETKCPGSKFFVRLPLNGSKG